MGLGGSVLHARPSAGSVRLAVFNLLRGSYQKIDDPQIYHPRGARNARLGVDVCGLE